MSSSDLSDLVEATETLRLTPALEYSHEALKYEQSIRLLVLQPASSAHAPLQCDLREVLLSDEPVYEAISYTWGKPVFSKELALPTGSLKITESLFLALQRFRLGDRIRHLWADAVCINQGDNVEKGKQVALMGEIYRNTQKVLVWLGPGDEYTGNVMDILKHLAAQSNRYGVQRTANGSILGGWAGSALPIGTVKEALEDVPIEYDWSGADAFYSLPWFSRIWIVQEIALGPSAHLYCGAFDISWDDFILGAHIEFRSVQRVTAMNLRLPYKFYQTRILEEGIRSFKNKQLGLKLLGLLTNFRFSDCSDARDRLYAMLSLRGIEDVEVTPNYNEPVTKIYTELAREMLRKNMASSRNIFYYAGVARKFHRKDKRSLDEKNTVHDIDSMPALEVVCEDLPSWVPDWRITGDYRSFHLNKATGSGYSAATRFRPNIQIDPGHGALSVVAKTIDIIKAGKNLGLEPELDYNAHREQVLLMKEFYDRQVGRLKPENDDALTLFARTIVADRTQVTSRTFLRDPLSVEDLRNLWLQFVSTPYKDESSTEHFETDGSEGRDAGTKMQNMAETSTIKAYSRLFCYRMALKNLLDDRQFIITNEGLAGLAPAIAQSGDHIVVFAGAATPLVLRPGGQDEKGRSRFYIIGDCFVHGVMYGELYEALQVGRWDWKTLS